MKKTFQLVVCTIVLLGFCNLESSAQVENLSKLTIKEVMQTDYTGHSPKSIRWSQDSKQLFFYWNPGNAKKDSAYQITTKNLTPERIDPEIISGSNPTRGNFSKDKNLKLVQSRNGIELINIKKKDTTTVYSTTQKVSNPKFSFDESKITFSIEQNLYWWSIETGEFKQLTNYQKEKEKQIKRPEKPALNEQDEWLKQDQKKLFTKVSSRGNRSFGSYQGYGRSMGGMSAGPQAIYLNGYSVYGTQLSPDNRFVTYFLNKGPETNSEGTKMPKYVTASGYTEIQNTRSKVGSLPSEMKMGIYDLQKDSVYSLDLSGLPGIFDAPEYYKEYDRKMKFDDPKPVYLTAPSWSKDGKYGVMTARSSDNKDRWIFSVDLASGKTKTLDHQHDEAWIAGPGIGYGGGIGWMPDKNIIWFQSEESGYSHIYTVNVETGEKVALTSGDFEIYRPFFSKDQKKWYFTSNEVHPGEHHFYSMPINGGKRTQITSMVGDNSITLSPDEKHLAITFSFANKPPELYYQENKPGAIAVQITDGRSEDFRNYNWRVPEFITFQAEDGTSVYARLYTPESNVKNEAAVIFVHGAGYLQNAHKWWSSYYHEYMFHNILADNGYTVLDIDYRGSAGYGRDCRTGIYRWMGGKDLSDQVDGASHLIKEHGINPDKIGLYGGSYGGFITLMAMFNAPEVFAAGAALRSVTDWAHYNHGYTANILNTPVKDSIAYAKSSPIYFAEGLKGHLLMCHGMLDDNVHFQDIVRLQQRLIDLGKDNWELAAYPLQRHSFTDPDAWTDEYKRIFKLFQSTIGSE